MQQQTGPFQESLNERAKEDRETLRFDVDFIKRTFPGFWESFKDFCDDHLKPGWEARYEGEIKSMIFFYYGGFNAVFDAHESVKHESIPEQLRFGRWFRDIAKKIHGYIQANINVTRQKRVDAEAELKKSMESFFDTLEKIINEDSRSTKSKWQQRIERMQADAQKRRTTNFDNGFKKEDLP